MSKSIVGAITIWAITACAEAPTASPVPAGESASHSWNESENFETTEQAFAAAQAANVLPDAVASAGWVDWSGGSAKSYGYFQYLNANYATGDARITTMLNNSTERDSQWQRASDSRVVTGGQYLDPWPAFRKNVSVPITRNCGLQAHVQAKMDAQLFAIVKWGPALIAHKEDDDAAWSEQGACAASQYSQLGGEGGDCGWFILQMQDYAGSWYDVGEPFQVCGDYHEAAMSKRKQNSLVSASASVQRTRDPITIATRPEKAVGSDRVKVRFRAGGPLEQSAVAYIQTDRSGAAALVVVDTTRAVPEDMEATILALRHFSDIGQAKVRIPIYKNDLGPAARERALGSSKRLLESLRATATQQGINKARVEVLTEIELPSIVVKRSR